MNNLVGRPTDYTEELADNICSQIAEGKSLKSICNGDNLPDISTIFRWIGKHKEFRDKYAYAKEESTSAKLEELELLGEEAIKLAQAVDFKASNAVVSAVKLKADNLKWVMSKLKPKKYGDKVDMTTNGKELPTPLLYAISNNYGNTKTLQVEEEN